MPERLRQFDELDLLAFVEGTIEPEREAALREALDAHPDLARSLELMLRDRRTLAALPDDLAPCGLIDRVLERLEREAIIGLEPEPVQAPPIPVSRVPALPRIRRRRLALYLRIGGLAAAAGFAIGGIVVSWIVLSRLSYTDPVISRETAPPRAARPMPLPPPPPAVELAVAEPVAPDAGVPDQRRLRRLEAQGKLISLAISPARAAQLAAEGRVAVRVRARDTAAASERVEDLIRRQPSNTVRFRSVDQAPGAPAIDAAFAALAGPAVRYVRLYAEPVSVGGADTAILDSFGPGALWRRNGAAPQASAPHPKRVAVDASPLLATDRVIYAADTRADARSLSELVQALSFTRNASVRFDELAEPIPAALDLDPESVLWWDHPPSSWVRRVSIPIVIEYTPAR